MEMNNAEFSVGGSCWEQRELLTKIKIWLSLFLFLLIDNGKRKEKGKEIEIFGLK